MIRSNSPAAVWHPFTQHALEPVKTRIVRTEGAYLIDEYGRSVLDAISSWWVITHRHRHPAIMEAIRTATETFDQIIFAEYTHEPAEKLARELIRVAPPGLAHVFYSDSGSTSVEVALKMALGFFHNNGAQRSRIVVMEHSYHGDTIGTMSAGERGIFTAAYRPLLFDVQTLPFPAPGLEQKMLDVFEHLCRSKEVAALLIEPLVLGGGGMKMYPAHLLIELKRIAERHGAPVNRRRGNDRLGENGHSLRLRTGRNHTGHPMPIQGDYRRCAASGCDTLFRRDLRCAPFT